MVHLVVLKGSAPCATVPSVLMQLNHEEKLATFPLEVLTQLQRRCLSLLMQRHCHIT
jgi:hypothetical protein